ncbi:MAG: glycosyltransferase family 2 protein [Elusimicrobiota bacterium]
MILNLLFKSNGKIMKDHKFLLYGVHFFVVCFIFFLMYVIGSILGVFSIYVFQSVWILNITNSFFIFGTVISILDFLVSAIFSEKKKSLMFAPVSNPQISVGLTAYNDDLSIGFAVKDFLSQKNVAKVIVVDNNSVDRTTEEGLKAGAEVVGESIQGYGACCIRALKEAMKFGNIVCLVEGDCTFSGSDLKKLIAYIENADMVIGTRTTKELNTPDSQLNFFIQWGNVFMAKLLQTRFWNVRLTDLGCTFRLIRKEALEKIIDQLKVEGNHFSCEMLLVALKNNLMIIEIPVTLKRRVGISKGVGGNFFKAAITALNMWRLIMFK